MRTVHAAVTTMLLSIIASSAEAQGPLEKLLPKSNSENLPRLPDDQIEGTIWEYKCKPRKKKDEGKLKNLEGRFRTEGSAIFDISRRLPLPGKDEVRKTVESIRKGELNEIKLPSAAQTKRIGEYRKLSKGRLRLDFNDEKSLNGLMVIWRKKKTDDVWMGTFTQKEGKKTVASWAVELRPIED